MRGKHTNGVYKDLLKDKGISDAKKWLVDQGYEVKKIQGTGIKPIEVKKDGRAVYYMTIAEACWNIYKANA